MCYKTEGCIVFTWTKPDFSSCPKSCWLKKEIKDRKITEKVISGFGPTISDKGSELSSKTKIFPDVSRIYKILKDQLNKGETVLV